MRQIKCFFILNVIITAIWAYRTMQPIRSSGYDMQCNTLQVFNTGIGGTASIFTYNNLNIVFSFKYAYISPPKVILTTSRYESNNDLTYNQYYAIYTVGSATATSIVASVRVVSPVFNMDIRYMAINSDFPYHINVYGHNKVYVGPSSFTSTTISTQYVNYTLQATGFKFNTFSPSAIDGSYENNKILLFLSCWHYKAAVQTPPTKYFTQVNVTAYVYNQSHYVVQIIVGQNATISGSIIHFNMLMFDVENVQVDGLNKLIYARVNFSDISGGFMPVPKQYWNATFYGFTDFSSESTKNYVFFKLFLGTLPNNNEGIIMLPPQHPNYPVKTSIQRYGITLFYLQSLICQQSNFYLNPITKKCYELLVETNPCKNQLLIKVPNSNYTKSDFNFWSLGTNLGIQLSSVVPDGKDTIIIFHYTKDIVNYVFQLRLPTRQIVYVKCDPFLPAVPYSQKQCQPYAILDKLVFAYVIMGYIVLFLSLFSAKIVGLQLFGVLQLCYFTLISHDFLNLYLSPLAQFRLFNGLNLFIIPQIVSLPSSLRYLKISSNFLNNCNLMLFIFFILLLIALICYIVSIFCVLPKIHQLCLRLLKQGVITFIMFNTFNISFSSGLHWNVANYIQDMYYSLGSFVIVATFIIIFISVMSTGLTDKMGFGEFKDKFKSNWVSQLHIPLQILQRIILGLYCSSTTNNSDSTITALGFSIFFFLYVAVNLPFIEYYQNYRTCLIHFTSVFILFVTNFYRTMKMNTPLTTKAYIFTPAILELVLVGICIIVSMAMLAYEFYLFTRGYHNNKRSRTSTMSFTESSHANINETLSSLDGK